MDIEREEEKNADSTVSEKYQHSKKGRRTDCLDRLLFSNKIYSSKGFFCLLCDFKRDVFFATGLNKKEYFAFPNTPFLSI